MNNEVIQFLEESHTTIRKQIKTSYIICGIISLVLFFSFALAVFGLYKSLTKDVCGFSASCGNLLLGYVTVFFRRENFGLIQGCIIAILVILLLLLAWTYKTCMEERRKLLKMAIEWEKFCVEKKIKCADNGDALIKTVVPVGFSPSPTPVEVCVKVEGIL